MDRYYSVSNFYKEKFGFKVYKIALDANCTCPTRDGTKGIKGCIFCSPSGSGDFAANKNLCIVDQIEQAKNLVLNKNHKGAFIAYFQNFTNTYGNVSHLESLYKEALSAEGIVGISIATRPDCIGDDILSVIAKLSENYFVTIELGLQTTKNESIEYIRRAYRNEEYDDAVFRIKKISQNIHIVTHVIFGLPGESKNDMLNTVQHCVDVKTDGIKMSVLHILSGTDLAIDYANGKFNYLEMDEYFDIVSSALEIIPSNVVIHRLTGDGAKRILIAPMWTANKKNVFNSMNRYFEEHNIIQGKHVSNGERN